MSRRTLMYEDANLDIQEHCQYLASIAILIALIQYQRHVNTGCI
jgi:hypothetical protein